MYVWRIARQVYDPLDGEGARRAGGRWNAPGFPVVYASVHLSLAVLELLVHLDLEDVPEDLAAFQVEIPDDLLIETVALEDLPETWSRMSDHPVCRRIGRSWLEAGTSAVLEVPSAVVALESNYLMSPAHPEFGRIRVVRRLPFRFDERLPGLRSEP